MMNRQVELLSSNRLRMRGAIRCLYDTSQKAPVVIVGGGPTGLVLSNLLSKYSVPSMLFEAQIPESRFRHPQAHFMNTRTMEIFRSELPKVYKEVLQSMRHVDEWKNFCFGPNMSAEPLAIVQHPVDVPLQAELDANGVLLDESNDINKMKVRRDLSPCRVGHLAQHTLGKILYRNAFAAGSMVQQGFSMEFGTTVAQIKSGSCDEGPVVILENGRQIPSSTVLVAEGSNSLTRRTLGIEWTGEQTVENLMNIHVRLDTDQATRLHADDNHAMLFTSFTPYAVAMTVCHSPGEYIIQIPFFPPLQTPMEDFCDDRLQVIVGEIFGPRVTQFQIVSARPWTMSAVVADQFYRNGIFLVGDAAHVFPPAGGFGMNTGVQDAHNLAWKIATSYHTNRMAPSDWNSVGELYEKERRPVAQRNAALSMRNYNRLLQVMKACYLDERHPNLLRDGLRYSGLPLMMQKTIFRSLWQAALKPFEWLSDSSTLYSQQFTKALRSELRMGTGLPLLFPRFELGFGYSDSRESLMDWKEDTQPHESLVKPGYLFPHVSVKLIDGKDRFPNLILLEDAVDTISLTDLPAQISEDGLPSYCLLYLQKEIELDDNEFLKIDGHLRAEIRLGFAKLVLDPSSQVTGHHTMLLLQVLQNASFPSDVYILLRPDGHVVTVQERAEIALRKGGLLQC